MANYYRITAYHKEKDISIIMDSYGMFDKLWRFSAYLVEKGFKIIAVGNDEQFSDGNFEKTDEIEKDKIILRACASGEPNVKDGRIEINSKFYISNN